MLKVALFDVDGTLTVAPDANHSHAVVTALTDTFGVTATVDEIHGEGYAGLTTPGIALRYLRERDVPVTEERLAQWREAMVAAFGAAAARSPHPVAFPDASEALHRLRDGGVRLGLLTGNFRAVAHEKLRSVGLLSFFDDAVSGFADDGVDRDAVAAAAAARARASGADVDLFVVGDTPRDIGCGQAVDATTVGVATGLFSADELHGADAVFGSLSDAASFILDSA